MLDDPQTFNGPTGNVIDPSTLSSIAIGLFAPDDPDDRASNELYRGIALAIEQANAGGGYRGVKFNLVQRWAADPWAAGSREVIRLVYEDRVWAVIGYKDGAGHIAQQIAAKAHVPVIAPLSSSSSLTLAGVPWIFRLPPDDRTQARVSVADGIIKTNLQRVGILSSTDHDSRSAASEIKKELQRRGIAPLFHFEAAPDLTEFQEIARRVREFGPGASMLCTRAAVLPGLLSALRGSGMDCPVLLPWVPGIETKKLQTAYDGPLYMIQPFQPSFQVEGPYRTFSREYKKRFGAPPTPSAAYGFDAARLIILAIQSNGLNRPAIRQALSELKDYKGVTGPVQWDNSGGNRANPVIIKEEKAVKSKNSGL
jgi:ABC-type branched-subunit amino acid transport system substrate-binding protein